MPTATLTVVISDMGSEAASQLWNPTSWTMNAYPEVAATALSRASGSMRAPRSSMGFAMARRVASGSSQPVS